MGNLATWAVGLPVLAEFNRRGIPFLVLKSLPQLEDLYGDIGVRSTTDVDLVVPGEYAVSAFDLILGLGWHLIEDSLLQLLTERQSRDVAICSHAWHFRSGRDDQPSGIDLQPDWLKPVLDGAIWDRAVPRIQDGVSFLVPSAEDRLLFLCWHFLEEAQFSGLAPWPKLVDIERALARSEDLDWEYLTRRAQTTGVSIAFHLTCCLATSRSSLLLSDRWRAVPVASPYRLKVLGWILGVGASQLSLRSHSLLRPLMYDQPLSGLRPWCNWLLPNRITVAECYLSHWPSRTEYLDQLRKIYGNRLRKFLR